MGRDEMDIECGLESWKSNEALVWLLKLVLHLCVIFYV